MKTICPIHRFMYNGSTCPLCEKERIDRLAKRYNPSPIENNETTITDNDLKRLIEKFSLNKSNK